MKYILKRIELDVKKLGIKNKELEEKLILVIEGFNESYEEQEKEQEFVNKLRRVWNGMKTRCYNPDALAYKNYGGRGIYICERWKDNFENFFDDMWRGYKDGLQIDRINNDGPYSPDNCRWVTPKENQRNKRTNHFITTLLGTKTIVEMAEICRIKAKLISSRLKSGIPEALSILPAGIRLNFKGNKLKRFCAGEEVSMTDEEFEDIQDIFTIAKVQAYAVKEWGAGPDKVILGNKKQREEKLRLRRVSGEYRQEHVRSFKDLEDMGLDDVIKLFTRTEP